MVTNSSVSSGNIERRSSCDSKYKSIAIGIRAVPSSGDMYAVGVMVMRAELWRHVCSRGYGYACRALATPGSAAQGDRLQHKGDGLQHKATGCSTKAMGCSTKAMSCSTKATGCSTRRRAAAQGDGLQHKGNTLQHKATECSTRRRSAAQGDGVQHKGNTLQHWPKQEGLPEGTANVHAHAHAHASVPDGPWSSAP